MATSDEWVLSTYYIVVSDSAGIRESSMYVCTSTYAWSNYRLNSQSPRVIKKNMGGTRGPPLQILVLQSTPSVPAYYVNYFGIAHRLISMWLRLWNFLSIDIIFTYNTKQSSLEQSQFWVNFVINSNKIDQPMVNFRKFSGQPLVIFRKS